MNLDRSMRSGRLFAFFALLVLFAMLQGCEYVRPTINAPLQQYDPKYGYRFSTSPAAGDNQKDRRDHMNKTGWRTFSASC